jgi:hypothetical protein
LVQIKALLSVAIRLPEQVWQPRHVLGDPPRFDPSSPLRSPPSV